MQQAEKRMKEMLDQAVVGQEVLDELVELLGDRFGSVPPTATASNNASRHNGNGDHDDEGDEGDIEGNDTKSVEGNQANVEDANDVDMQDREGDIRSNIARAAPSSSNNVLQRRNVPKGKATGHSET